MLESSCLARKPDWLDTRLVQLGMRRNMPRSEVKYGVIHRLSLADAAPGNPEPIPDAELCGADVCRIFEASDLLGTGSQRPYTALVRQSGRVDQLLPLTARGAHARGYNGHSLSVAVVGNTDERPILAIQLERLIEICVWFSVWADLELVGHTDLPGASKDPNKRCPGRHLSVHSVETHVSWRVGDLRHLTALERQEWVLSHGLIA